MILSKISIYVIILLHRAYTRSNNFILRISRPICSYLLPVTYHSWLVTSDAHTAKFHAYLISDSLASVVEQCTVAIGWIWWAIRTSRCRWARRNCTLINLHVYYSWPYRSKFFLMWQTRIWRLHESVGKVRKLCIRVDDISWLNLNFSTCTL